MDKKKIALIFGCAALIGAFSITAPNPSWAAACDAACQAEKVEIKVAAAKAAKAPNTGAAEAAVEKEAAVDKKVKKKGNANIVGTSQAKINETTRPAKAGATAKAAAAKAAATK